MTPEDFRRYLLQLESLLELDLSLGCLEGIASLFLKQWQFEFVDGLDGLGVFPPSSCAPLPPLELACLCRYLSSSPNEGAWPLLSLPNYLLLLHILEVSRPSYPLWVLRQWVQKIYGPYFFGEQAEQLEEDLLQEVAGYVVYLEIGSLSRLLVYFISTDLFLPDEKGQLQPLSSEEVKRLLSCLVYDSGLEEQNEASLRKIKQRVKFDLEWTAAFLHEFARGGGIPPRPSGEDERGKSYRRVLSRLQRLRLLTREVKEL